MLIFHTRHHQAIWDSKSTASQVGLEVGTKCYLDVRSSPLLLFVNRPELRIDALLFLRRTLPLSRPRSTASVLPPSVTPRLVSLAPPFLLFVPSLSRFLREARIGRQYGD